MILTPEVAGIVASAMGLIGLIARKARCFIRRVSGRWDCGIGFTDGRITPEISREVKICVCQHPPITTDGIPAPMPPNSLRRALSSQWLSNPESS